MGKEYWTVTEVVKIFQVDERFLHDLEEEEIICAKNILRQSSSHLPILKNCDLQRFSLRRWMCLTDEAEHVRDEAAV